MALSVSQDTPLAAQWAAGRTMRIVDGQDEVHLLQLGRGENTSCKEDNTGTEGKTSGFVWRVRTSMEGCAATEPHTAKEQVMTER
jgi:hypothetical protein